jgi:hypothetical protein
MFNSRTGLVECLCEEGRLVLLVGFVRDDRSDAALARRPAIGLAGIALVADDGAGLNVRSDGEQRFEVPRIGRLPARQIEADDRARCIRFGVDLGGEPTARPPERLPFLPPFAPAADTWARTTVESNIWIRCAEALMPASASKKASKTPALLSRSNRFQTLFQGPKRSGKARHRMFSTAKK